MSEAVKNAVGVDLGGTNIKIGIVSESGKIHNKISLKTNASKGTNEVVRNIINGVRKILSKNKLKISGIGIGAPGVVNIEKGTVENPPNFPGWTKVNLIKILQKEFKYKIHVENDANVAAIGEMIFGAGRKHNSFIMVTLGTGVGGGIVINKKIFHGEFGAAGEIGHVTINYKGTLCNCGSFGCIETFIGNHYLVNSVKLLLQSRKDSLIWKILNDNLDILTPRIIQEAAEKGDEFSSEVIVAMGEQLGAVFASVSNLLDIRTYIIGGGVAGFGKPLFNAIQDSVTKRVLKPLKGSIKIIPARLKNDAGIKGASALVFYRSA